jgi:hypothetical protein
MISITEYLINEFPRLSRLASFVACRPELTGSSSTSRDDFGGFVQPADTHLTTDRKTCALWPLLEGPPACYVGFQIKSSAESGRRT